MPKFTRTVAYSKLQFKRGIYSILLFSGYIDLSGKMAMGGTKGLFSRVLGFECREKSCNLSHLNNHRVYCFSDKLDLSDQPYRTNLERITNVRYLFEKSKFTTYSFLIKYI